jgi:hypothetical protein
MSDSQTHGLIGTFNILLSFCSFDSTIGFRSDIVYEDLDEDGNIIV